MHFFLIFLTKGIWFVPPLKRLSGNFIFSLPRRGHTSERWVGLREGDRFIKYQYLSPPLFLPRHGGEVVLCIKGQPVIRGGLPPVKGE